MVSSFVRLRFLSASDIKRNWLSGDQAYVIAWVDPEVKKRTMAISAANKTTVQWNEELDLPFSSSIESKESLKDMILTMEIRSKGVFGDSVLATVYVPLTEIPFDGVKEHNSILTYQAFQPSERKQYGCLNFVGSIMQSVKSSDSSVEMMSNNTGMGCSTYTANATYASEEALSGTSRPAVYSHSEFNVQNLVYPSLCLAETTTEVSSWNGHVSYPSSYQPNYSQTYLLANHPLNWQQPPPQEPYHFASSIYSPLSGPTTPYEVSSNAINYPSLPPYPYFPISPYSLHPVNISEPHFYSTSVYPPSFQPYSR